jgi:predicted phosphohydrolase
MKAVCINDVHLDTLHSDRIERFFDELAEHDADCVLLAGDIAQADSVAGFLEGIAEAAGCPVYFVLGNHDYWGGSIAGVRRTIHELCGRSDRLCWLNDGGVVLLSETVSLVGHDGWGDARLGNVDTTDIDLVDLRAVEELCGRDRAETQARLRALGDGAADHFRKLLPEALRRRDHVVVVTHVPPYAEATWYDGEHSGPDWLPYFACKAVGDALREAMAAHPAKQMIVLCGHTHGGGTAHILPNLIVHTIPAVACQPAVRRVFEW